MTRESGKKGGEGRSPGGRRRPRPDRSILDGVRRRDPQALGEFFERYAENLYGLAFRMLGDVPTAQDVIQNVFLRVHRAADRLDPERDPAPWLATITVNECRALWRSRAYRVEREGRSLQADDGLADRLSSDGTGPDRMVLDQEREAILQRAIEELPEQMRAVVLLHDYREFTHEEIATIVGASPAAVRKRYSRALERLREHLKSKLS